MITQINTISDVKSFAKHLVEIEKLSFHPDDDFSDYINLKTKEPFYTKDEATLRNKLMTDSFEVCNRHNIEIYAVLLSTIAKPFLDSN